MAIILSVGWLWSCSPLAYCEADGERERVHRALGGIVGDVGMPWRRAIEAIEITFTSRLALLFLIGTHAWRSGEVFMFTSNTDPIRLA